VKGYNIQAVGKPVF